MSLWILHASLSSLPERGEGALPLPLNVAEDFTNVGTSAELRRRLRALHPEMPPESLNREADRIWTMTHGLGREDIFAVPLGGEVVLAEALGGARYTGVEGALYEIPVRFLAKRYPLRSFGAHRRLFEPCGLPLMEVTDPRARAAIRDRLPRHASRWRRVKWILGVMIALKIFYFTLHFIRGNTGAMF